MVFLSIHAKMRWNPLSIANDAHKKRESSRCNNEEIYPQLLKSEDL